MISSTPPPLATLDVESDKNDVQHTTSSAPPAAATTTSSNNEGGLAAVAENAIHSVVERISPIADIHDITGKWNYLYFAIAFCALAFLASSRLLSPRSTLVNLHRRYSHQTLILISSLNFTPRKTSNIADQLFIIITIMEAP